MGNRRQNSIKGETNIYARRGIKERNNLTIP